MGTAAASVASSPLLSESPSVSLAVLADTQGLGFDFLAFLVGGMSLSRSISTKVFAEISFGFALPVSTITPTASSSTSVIVIPLCTLKRFVCGWKLCPLKRFVCGGVPSPRGTSVWCIAARREACVWYTQFGCWMARRVVCLAA
jgi:hypothetical protein